ncbi:MAG: metal-dependent hydrolase [Candidatus Sigynarchaeota archaeon]
MPDWFAHLMLAYVVSACLRLDARKCTIFFIGNVMPDLVRIMVLADNIVHSDFLYYFIALPINTASHSLLGVFAFALFISLFFEPTLPAGISGGNLHAINARKPVLLDHLARWWQKVSIRPFFLLIFGGIVHLLLDTFMWPYGGGIFWLYPLTDAWFRWSFGAWWPSTFDGILWLLPFFVATIACETIFKIKHA